ncbi:MAG: pyridoxal phosphate-dependent aminotransferase [Bacteroidales bacterium]|nr:pyridoxal phosphate-dependent aminotransferase [Bacteroidales bacterium]
MPEISKKGQLMPPSPIRKLVPYADQAKAKGIKVYHLNIGQPDIPTPEIALEALRNYREKVIEYSHSAGLLSYRKKLVEYYERHGIYLNTDQIIVTTGGSEAILFAFNSTMDEGDEVIIPEPYYANYNGFAVNAGVRVVPIPSNIENGFTLPPIEEFEKKITSRTKAILICNPNNPTGYLYSREEIEQLGKLVKKYNLFLIADEVYREFVFDGFSHFSVMNLEGLEDHVIMVDSVSKRYSACGFRIGAFITRNKELFSTAMKFAQARLSPPTFGQIAAQAAVDTPASYFEEVLKEYKARRDVVVKSINEIPGALCPTPRGAFYVVARLPIDDSDKFCQWLLENFSDNNETIMLAPATGFYADPTQSGKNEVRISFVLEVKHMQRSMELLKIALNKYPGTIH